MFSEERLRYMSRIVDEPYFTYSAYSAPVSYTHLDVYKRQSLQCGGSEQESGDGRLPEGPGAGGIAQRAGKDPAAHSLQAACPVSYTHLDVYKRQSWY